MRASMITVAISILLWSPASAQHPPGWVSCEFKWQDAGKPADYQKFMNDCVESSQEKTRPASEKKECYKIGDTVIVRGSTNATINGGTYFVPFDRICVRYPKPTDKFAVDHLTTIGMRLPSNIYVEVTGELRDPYPELGIGLHPSTFRNVDSEVKTLLADAIRRCEQWQKENSPKLRERTHGARVVLSPQNERGEDYTRYCAIWAVDTALPHELVTVRRPHP